MSGRKLPNPVDHRVRSRNVVQREVQIQAVEVDSPLDLLVDEERFQLGAEVQIVPAPMDVQRLYSEPVPTQISRRSLSVQIANANMPRSRETTRVPTAATP